jgi:uncharacterized membrane protein YraQ (UPF0718 family)
MGYQVWWALVLGFLISAIVQAWVPRARIESALAGGGARELGVATGLGAASSSCSYAAVAIGKSLFGKGASAVSMLAFQFASTNLVWELGLVLWVLIGWQFTLAEYVGGLLMTAAMALLTRALISPAQEHRARRHLHDAEARDRQNNQNHHHHHQNPDTQATWSERLGSLSSWTHVAHNFRGDWQMLWKEITIGFFLAGYLAQLPHSAFNSLFLTGAPHALQTVWGAFIGPLIAVASFVCSVGNVPLAAVLWSGGISFAGVIAFLFADLLVLPIVAIYRKYYGGAFAARIVALMFVSMVAAALAVDAIFGAVGLIPGGPRPTKTQIFSAVTADYKLYLNVAALAVFGILFWLTVRHRARQPGDHAHSHSHA